MHLILRDFGIMTGSKMFVHLHELGHIYLSQCLLIVPSNLL